MFIMPSLYELKDIESHSASPGNPTGARAGALPEYRHCVGLDAGETRALADIRGPGMLRGLWFTCRPRDPETLRSLVVRIHWDDADYPSVEAPFGDFFGAAHGRLGHYSTPCLGISEGKGFWCFFPMPFGERCRVTIENDSPNPGGVLYYQINYTLGDVVTEAMGRFHAHFRRATPPEGSNHLILDTSDTPGVYVGTVLSALPQTAGTWREGEFQFYIDGDAPRPSIVGTGWSDWFLSGWGLGVHQSLYAGSSYQVIHPELNNKSFCSCYRFHLMDPIYFHQELRVEHTQIGRRDDQEAFGERSDDWCSVAYWYQRLTGHRLPELPPREERLKGIEVQPWEVEALERMRDKTDEHTDGGPSGMVF